MRDAGDRGVAVASRREFFSGSPAPEPDARIPASSQAQGPGSRTRRTVRGNDRTGCSGRSRSMKATALHDTHLALGARMVEFGGWHMPVQYGPILDEVRTVRERSGLFDLCHMGRVRPVGSDAVRLVQKGATRFFAAA